MHIRNDNVDKMPAPFLNRFEKYSLCVDSVLEWRLSTTGPARCMFEAARSKVLSVIRLLGEDGFVGRGADSQVLSSMFVDMLARTEAQTGGCPSFNSKGSKGNEGHERHLHLLVSAIHQSLVSSTTLTCSHDDVLSVFRVSRMSLESTYCLALNDILEGRIEPDKVEQSVRDIWCVEKSQKSTLHSLCGIITRMVMVRASTFRILQLATPEAIFSRR